VTKQWGDHRRVAWIVLALSYLMSLPLSELFAEGDGRVHAVYCLRGGDVAFYAGECQVKRGNSPKGDMVEVHFRGSIGEQRRNVAVLVMMKVDEHNGGKTVELLQGCTG